MTDNDDDEIEAPRPAPNLRHMRDDALIIIDLLLGVERLCDCGDGYTESIRALTVRAGNMLADLKTDIQGMIKR